MACGYGAHMALTPLARLVEEKLRQASEIAADTPVATLNQWIDAKRRAGQTWEDIALDIRVVTGERVVAETARTWHPKPPETAPVEDPA